MVLISSRKGLLFDFLKDVTLGAVLVIFFMGFQEVNLFLPGGSSSTADSGGNQMS